MSSFLVRFEAIESRIASLPCPVGTSGRLRALRLQRSYQVSEQRQMRRATTSLPITTSNETVPYFNTKHDRGAVDGKDLFIGAQLRTNGKLQSNSPAMHAYRRNVGIPEAGQLRISGVPRKSNLQQEVSYQPLPNLDPPYLIERLHTSVQTGDHQQVLDEILRQISFVGVEAYAQNVLSHVPATTFSEILYALEPRQHIGRFAELYQELSPRMSKNLRIPAPNEYGRHEFLAKFLKHISIIFSTRANTQPLSVQDYKILLKCARSVGEPDSAKVIWQQLQHHVYEETLKADADPTHQVPSIDVECYNHYMAALCWSDIHNPYHRHQLRVSKVNIAGRQKESESFRLSGHRVGPTGLKATVATLFQRMVQARVTPNEETFCLMAISMAREGELEAVSSLLGRAWGLDVEAVLAGEATNSRHYESSDPVRPSEQLLMTLAHAYSINKSISVAIQLVDHVSQQYSIPISHKVWTELLERSVMLSKHQKQEPEAIANAAASNLFATMTAKPYDLEPDMRMYNLLINSELKQKRLGRVQVHIEHALKVHDADVKTLSVYIEALDSTDSSTSPLVRRRRSEDVAYQHLRVKVNRQYIRRWLRNWFYLGSRYLGRTWNQDVFSSLNVPHIVAEYSTFLPAIVKYKTPTGTVELHSHSRRANYARQVEYARRSRRSVRFGSRHRTQLPFTATTSQIRPAGLVVTSTAGASNA